MLSPYKNRSIKNWGKITDELIKKHPLPQNEFVEIILQSWEQILKSRIGSFKIGKDIFPSPQIMSFLLHELMALNLANKYPEKFRTCCSKEDKDIVCVINDEFSIEVKASSSTGKIYGNRSYAQANTEKSKKNKNGYIVAINFEKWLKTNKKKPKIVCIKFGYLEHTDWVAQSSETGQQASLTKNAQNLKLVTIYNSRS
jgi:hypothetical protein